MKEIIIDIMNETAEIKIETKGFNGPKCLKESQFLKDALGVQTEQSLLPTYYKKDIRKYKPICG